MLIDSHCHIHDHEFYTAEQSEEVYSQAIDEKVKMLCVGTSQPDSRLVVAFAGAHEDVWAIVGVHPHETKDGVADIGALLAKKPAKIVGIGEIGLDYYYNHSSKEAQIAGLEQQLQWAMDYDLPVSFHVRDASPSEGRESVWKDFWPILDNFNGIRGVLHSFTDTVTNLEKGLERGLYIGVNGISTFARDKQDMFAAVPLERMLLETDAPFLTPVPKRGNMNEPAFVRYVAAYHAHARGISLEEISQVTSANAMSLFALSTR